MKKWMLALGTMLALSIGIAWAEGTNAKKSADCQPQGSACCCCAKSCPK